MASKKNKGSDAAADRPQRRGYGDGAVYQIKDGRWRGSVEFGHDARGHRVRRTVSAKTRAQALQKVRALRAEQAGGEPVAPRNRRRTEQTLGQWLDRWLAAARDELAVDTHKRYVGLVEHQLKPTLGQKFLKDIKPTDVRLAIAEIRRMPKRDRAGRPLDGEVLSDSSVRQSYAVLRRALRSAVEDELITSNPAAAVAAPKVDPTKRRGVAAFDVPDARRLIAAASQRAHPARWYLGTVLGARQGECLGLAWDTVDLDAEELSIVQQLKERRWEHGCSGEDRCEAYLAGCPTGRPCAGGPDCPHAWHRARNRPCPTPPAQHPMCVGKPCCVFSAKRCPHRRDGGFYISRTKNRKQRTMTLPRFVVDSLRDEKARQDAARAAAGVTWQSRRGLDGLVFTDSLGRPVGKSQDRDEWLKLLADAGLAESRLHNLRHTAATVLTDLGYDTAVIQTILGQSQAATTRGYQQTTAATTAGAADALDVLYSRNADT